MSTSRTRRAGGGGLLPEIVFGAQRACARSVGVLVLLVVGGCATGHMWHTLTKTDYNRKAMYYESGTPASWVDYVGAVLLAPITVAIDVVLFPIQILGGYWPYGDKDAP